MKYQQKESPRIVVETHQNHVLNVTILQLLTRGGLWYMMGFYLEPHDTSTMERIIAAT